MSSDEAKAEVKEDDIAVAIVDGGEGKKAPDTDDGNGGDGGGGGEAKEGDSQPPAAKAQFTSVDEGISAAAGSDAGVSWNGEGKAPDAFHKVGYKGRIKITDRGQLLRKCVSTMYQTITKRRGPMATFYGAHLDEFNDDEEHKLVYTSLHKEFEAILDNALTAFAHEEGFATPRELYAELQDAVAEGGTKEEKMVKMICAAADYKKFVRLMKNKARKQRKLEGQQATIYNSTYGSGGASSAAISGENVVAAAAAAQNSKK